MARHSGAVTGSTSSIAVCPSNSPPSPTPEIPSTPSVQSTAPITAGHCGPPAITVGRGVSKRRNATTNPAVTTAAAPSHTGRVADEQMLEILRTANGRFGSTLAYLVETATSLRNCGIRDRDIERLVELARRNALTA